MIIFHFNYIKTIGVGIGFGIRDGLKNAKYLFIFINKFLKYIGFELYKV